MKVITRPSVYVVGKQQVAEGEMERFLSDHGVSWESDSDVPGEVLIETSGRLCYMSFSKPRPGGNEAYIKHLKEVGHGSCLEHAVWTIIVSGVSRSLTHELVRHRIGMSPSQLSQRYVDESVAEYVVPPDLKDEVECALHNNYFDREILCDWACDMEAAEKWPVATRMRKQQYQLYWDYAEVGQMWLDSLEFSHAKYVRLSEYLTKKATSKGLSGTDGRKFARQAARSVLPNATETKIAITANARALRNIFELRASRHADPEIRILAHAIWQALVKDSPNLFSDYQEVPLPDGTTELITPYRKV